MAESFDKELFDEIRQQALELVDRYTARDRMFEDIRKMFNMEWTDRPSADWIKPTLSPSAYNSVIGAFRLLVSTDPQVNVPTDEDNGGSLARSTADKLERWCKGTWAQSGRITQRPAHYDALFGSILFGEVAGCVTKTSDLLAYAEGTKRPDLIARMKYVAATSPYLFEFYNPQTSYPDFDTKGVRALCRRVKTTWGEVLATWGQLALESIGEAAAASRRRSDEINLNDWYDWGYRCVWMDESDTPILLAEHGLGFLPVVAQVTDGTGLFTKPEEARFPLLYSVYKSGMWNRENLSLTTIFTLIFALAQNPQMVRQTNEPGKPLTVDRTIPGGVLDIGPDERLTPLTEKILDPSLMQGLQIVSQTIQDSTISKQSLGLPPGYQMPYSALSLLAQSGRLPLIGPGVLGGQAIANLMGAALRWYKLDGERYKVQYAGKTIELDPDEIPDNPAVDVMLEPDVPQDKLQLANTAAQINTTNLASRRWVRENILQIGQSGAMDKEIWMEQRTQAEVEKALAVVQAEAQAAAQQIMAQAQAAAQPAPQPAPGGQPGQAPQPAGPFPPGGVMPGQPLSGPLPPQGQAPAG